MGRKQENADCPCGKGTYTFPNNWWRDVLRLLRCTWCGHEAEVARDVLREDEPDGNDEQ